MLAYNHSAVTIGGMWFTGDSTGGSIVGDSGQGRRFKLRAKKTRHDGGSHDITKCKGYSEAFSWVLNRTH